jgi:hypothetical protein
MLLMRNHPSGLMREHGLEVLDGRLAIDGEAIWGK